LSDKEELFHAEQYITIPKKCLKKQKLKVIDEAFKAAGTNNSLFKINQNVKGEQPWVIISIFGQFVTF
jgi:hypothetical protein